MATAANAKASTTWRPRVRAWRASEAGAERAAGGIRAAAYRARALARDTGRRAGALAVSRARLIHSGCPHPDTSVPSAARRPELAGRVDPGGAQPRAVPGRRDDGGAAARPRGSGEREDPRPRPPDRVADRGLRDPAREHP